jgi:hypothetical protein
MCRHFVWQGGNPFGCRHKRARIGNPTRQIGAPAGTKEAGAIDQELAMLEAARPGEERVCRGCVFVGIDGEIGLISAPSRVSSGAIVADGHQLES